MSQPLNWWRDLYASAIYQGLWDEFSLEQIQSELDNLIIEAQKPFER